MSENLSLAVQLLFQGMLGIFVVLGVIALLVMLLQKVDHRAEDRRQS